MKLVPLKQEVNHSGSLRIFEVSFVADGVYFASRFFLCRTNCLGGGGLSGGVFLRLFLLNSAFVLILTCLHDHNRGIVTYPRLAATGKFASSLSV